VSRRTIARWLEITLLLAGAVLVWRVVAWHPLSVPDTAVTDRFVRVSGVAHIHTTHSDGGGTVADIESAAAAAGLDFVIVTDHNSLAAKPREGYGDTGVLTIVGTEISNHEGHLLAVGLPAQTYPAGPDLPLFGRRPRHPARPRRSGQPILRGPSGEPTRGPAMDGVEPSG